MSAITGREHTLLLERLQSAMEREGLDALLLMMPENIFYATGYASDFAYFSGDLGRTVAVVPAVGSPGIVCSEFEQLVAVQQAPHCRIEGYPVFIYIEDFCKGRKELPSVMDFTKPVRMAMEMLGLKKGAKLGVEDVNVPHGIWEFLTQELGAENLVDCTPMLVRCKSRKTPWEIDTLRKSASLCDQVLARVIQETEPGQTEADIANKIHRYSYDQSKEITSIVQVNTMGKNISPALIFRSDPLVEGDIVRLDASVNICCYNSDIARTYAVGKAVDPRRQYIYDAMMEGYEKTMSMIGPGVPFKAVFDETLACIRKRLPDYIRGHFGHSISCNRSAEDGPRISANEPGCFEPNMVFCVEWPYYSSVDQSYNIEEEILITENGFEQLTFANKTLIVS